MKKILFAIILLAPFSTLLAQQLDTSSTNSSIMLSGISFVLMVVICLMIYLQIQKNNLHKENKKLQDRIKELEAI